MASSNFEIASKLESLSLQLSAVAGTLRKNASPLSAHCSQRISLLQALETIAANIRQPQDEMKEFIPRFVAIVAIRLFMKWGVFEKIPLDGTAVSYEELAKSIGADVNLITRFAWILGATGVFKQVGTDQVAHTDKSRVYANVNTVSAVFKLCFDEHFTPFVYMPQYFEKYGAKEPVDRHHTLWAFSNGDPAATVWEIMNRDPARLANFTAAMAGMEHTWPVSGSYDFKWAAEKVARDQEKERPVVVDVGGGKGHCLREICKENQGLPVERCVLEDLPEVLQAAKNADDLVLRGAKMVAVDFHKEQPVKGALIYYMRRCLHDYGDAECIQILQHLADAMAEDSRLLIVEQVIGNPPSMLASAMDMLMLEIGGKERPLENFQQITQEAGLRILKVWTTPETDTAVIECMKC